MGKITYITILSNKPNSHTFTYSFDPAIISHRSSILLGNSSLLAFATLPKNQTAFIVCGYFPNLDTDIATALRYDLWRENGIPLTIQLDTEVSVKAGGLWSKKVGLRVTCDGFEVIVAPKVRVVDAVPASVRESKCEVNLGIKLRKFTW